MNRRYHARRPKSPGLARTDTSMAASHDKEVCRPRSPRSHGLSAACAGGDNYSVQLQPVFGHGGKVHDNARFSTLVTVRRCCMIM